MCNGNTGPFDDMDPIPGNPDSIRVRIPDPELREEVFEELTAGTEESKCKGL